jgi:hypothetical protein
MLADIPNFKEDRIRIQISQWTRIFTIRIRIHKGQRIRIFPIRIQIQAGQNCQQEKGKKFGLEAFPGAWVVGVLLKGFKKTYATV